MGKLASWILLLELYRSVGWPPFVCDIMMSPFKREALQMFLVNVAECSEHLTTWTWTLLLIRFVCKSYLWQSLKLTVLVLQVDHFFFFTRASSGTFGSTSCVNQDSFRWCRLVQAYHFRTTLPQLICFWTRWIRPMSPIAVDLELLGKSRGQARHYLVGLRNNVVRLPSGYVT